MLSLDSNIQKEIARHYDNQFSFDRYRQQSPLKTIQGELDKITFNSAKPEQQKRNSVMDENTLSA